MRDLVALISLIIMLPMGVSSVVVAYLLWGWSGLIALDSYLYGFMTTFRFNMIFALVALVKLLTATDPQRGSWQPSRTTILLSLWVIQATASATFAYPENPGNWNSYIDFIKAMLFVFVMPLVITTKYRIHALTIVICLGLSFHGLIDGLKFFASGGGHNAQGLAKFGDNNHFAVVMILVVPLCLYLGQTLKQRLMRLGANATAVLSLAAVIATHSRGGLLSLLAVGVWFLLASKRKAQAIIVALVFAMVVIPFAPESWTTRMSTIKTAEQDNSFMQRVEAWQVSSAIALENPITGGGFYAVQTQFVWERFRGQTGLLGFVSVIDQPSVRYRAAHSIYFQVLGDFGFVGLFIFLGILACPFLNYLHVKRLSASVGGSLTWATGLSFAICASVFGYMVGGAAVSLAYLESLYVLVMFSEVIRLHAVAEFERSAGSKVRP